MTNSIRFIIVMLAGVFLGMMFNPPLASVSAQQQDEWAFFYQWVDTTNPTTALGDIVRTDSVNPDDGFLKRTLRLFNLDQFIASSDAWALEYAKSLINRALGYVALIAFIVVLYGFGQMIFAEDEAGITTARKVVTSAAIAIAILGISRMVVTFLFAIYDAVKGI